MRESVREWATVARRDRRTGTKGAVPPWTPTANMPAPQAPNSGQNGQQAGAQVARVWPNSLQWWPTFVGVAFAAFCALDMFRGSEGGRDLASILAASGLVYLGAAALQKPSTAWPLFLGTVVVITASRVSNRAGWADFDATWVLLGLAALFVLYGLRRGAARPIDRLPLQTIAMLGFGMTAAIALMVSGHAGPYLVAAGLLGHAAWDVYHHWANRVVVRSMAEFCFVLDTLLAVAIVVATVRS